MEAAVLKGFEMVVSVLSLAQSATELVRNFHGASENSFSAMNFGEVFGWPGRGCVQGLSKPSSKVITLAMQTLNWRSRRYIFIWLYFSTGAEVQGVKGWRKVPHLSPSLWGENGVLWFSKTSSVVMIWFCRPQAWEVGVWLPLYSNQKVPGEEVLCSNHLELVLNFSLIPVKPEFSVG